MQIVENKALQFVTKKHAQIKALIPKSHILETRGDKAKMMVYWGEEEWRVLKNLGIKNPPHPIIGRYKWPGVYKPFDHQRVTAAFLASHPRAYCFNEQGCVDADTEYLTPTGWKRIADYGGGEVAQFDPKTGRAEFVTPTEYIKLPCETMIRFKTKYGVDQLLSGEHRVLAYDNALPGKYVVMSANDVKAKYERYLAGIRDPKGRTVGKPTVSYRHLAIKPHFTIAGGDGIQLTEPQLRVQIAVIADGHFGSGTDHCVVRLKRDRKIERLRTLLSAAGVSYRERVSEAPTDAGFHIFTFKAPMRVKEFGPEFWVATDEQLAIVRDEVMHWDGCFRKGAKGAEFTSTSKASADFVQYAFASAEFIARVVETANPDKYTSGVCYAVYVRKKTGTNLLALHSSSKAGDTVRYEPSTDGYKYCFTVPKTFLVLRRNGCVFTTGNTAKTASASWAADYLLTIGRVKRVLIICPVSIMDTAWRADLFRTVMHRKVAIASGTRAQREAVIASDAEFVIINFDGVKVVHDALMKGGFDLIIIDEATGIKNVTTARWKAIAALASPKVWVWAMTGTPASQSPEDAYGLAKLLKPDSVPRWAGAWKDRVMTKITQYKWVPKPNAKDIVFETLQPAIRFTKEQCLDLPDILYTTREVEMTAQQAKFYNQIKKQMVALAAGEEITAANAAGLLNKLAQCASGAVYTDSGEVIEFDVSNRLEELFAIIDGTDHKVLVFVPFRHAMDLLQDKLVKHLGSLHAVEMIRGGINASARAETIKRFQTEDNPKVLLLAPQATAHGITLTRADQIVWWGPHPSTEIYLQANARAHRAGQKNCVTVTHLQGSPVEKRIYDMLQNKVEAQLSLVELYKQEIA